MRGHVRKRGTSWSYVYDAGRDESGRRKQSWRSGFATKKAAQEALAATLTDIKRQEHVDHSEADVRTLRRRDVVAARAGDSAPVDGTRSRRG